MKIEDLKDKWYRRGIIIPGTKHDVNDWSLNLDKIESLFFKHGITDTEKSFCEKIQTEDSITGRNFDIVAFFNDDCVVDMPKINSIKNIGIFVTEVAGNLFSRKRINFPLLLFSHTIKNL